MRVCESVLQSAVAGGVWITLPRPDDVRHQIVALPGRQHCWESSSRIAEDLRFDDGRRALIGAPLTAEVGAAVDLREPPSYMYYL